MKIQCPHCRSEQITFNASGTLARCLTCLYSWIVVSPA